MSRTRGTLADVIDRTLESERRLGLATPPAAEEHLRTLLIAVDNLERARERIAHTDPAHLVGCVRRLADARRAAEDFLKPGTSALC